MRILSFLLAFLLIPKILHAAEGQKSSTEFKNQVGLEYNTNYFGNMGNVNYAYQFAKYTSVYANAGFGYLSLQQDLDSGFPTVSSSPGVNGKVSIFIQNVFDLGVLVHFYKLNKQGFFRNIQLCASHIFLNFTHTYEAGSQGTKYTGTKNYSLWGFAVGIDIYEYRFSEALLVSFGVKGYIFFVPLPQTLQYKDSVGNISYFQLVPGTGDGQGLGIFPYPVFSISLKYSW